MTISYFNVFNFSFGEKKALSEGKKIEKTDTSLAVLFVNLAETFMIGFIQVHCGRVHVLSCRSHMGDNYCGGEWAYGSHPAAL